MNDLGASLQPPATASFFDRARARLTLDVPPALTDPRAEGARGDLDLNPDVWERAGVQATKPAAVLVPIIDRSEPTVLLTLRTADLTSHAGQVAFPGGKIDPGDTRVRSPPRCARPGRKSGSRRLHRADRLSRSLSDLFRLPHSADGGARQAGLHAALNPREVTETFEVPLTFLMTPDNHQRKTRDWNGFARDYYAIPFENRYIWGITAGILRNLYERVYGA